MVWFETMKLLLVEDDPAMRTTLLRALTRLGWSVDLCADGSAALAQWQQTRPDVVLLDLSLPGLDGLHVLAHLDRAWHGGRPHPGAECRRRRLPAQAL